jgi:hypothetical protein
MAYYVGGMKIKAIGIVALGVFGTAAMAGPHPAMAQNATGLLTPFSTNSAPPMLKPPMPGGGDGGGHHDGGYGDGGHRGHHDFPVLLNPFFDGFIDNGDGGSVQTGPVNPQPFVPATPPAPGDRPDQPYKPPSVEIAPGGIEIVRGPG